jgi:sec-independent protein translocase protein TatC
VAFVIAAVLAPPDVVSQIALAIPLMLFYEISILIGGVIERKRAAADKAAEEAEQKAEEAEKAGEASGS